MQENKGTRLAVGYRFYQVDPAWRRLPEEERRRGKEQFTAVVDEASPQVTVRCYSLVGLRADVDLLLWQMAPTLEAIQDLAARLISTELGKYLTTPYSYLAMTRRSPYIGNHRHEGQDGLGRGLHPRDARYLFVYPFVKTHEWYQLPFEERQAIMHQHFEIGHKYPSVRIHTTYSFGIDDQDHMLAFESDDPSDFLECVMELRETRARPYTERDTPIFTCVRRDPREALDLLGG